MSWHLRNCQGTFLLILPIPTEETSHLWVFPNITLPGLPTEALLTLQRAYESLGQFVML